MKDAFYFPHDYDSRNDEKIVRMLRVHGWTGYGLYWAVIEKIYGAGGQLNVDYETLAFDLRVEMKMVESLIGEFELFYIKANKIRSHSVDRRLKKRHEKTELAKASASHRWRNADAMRTHSDGNANGMLERKGKEIKGNQIKGSLPTAPFSSAFCEYNDRGQGQCDQRKVEGSKYCPDHKLKVREKFLTKGEKRGGFTSAADIIPGVIGK
jgi:hypothetical protein